MAQRNLGLVGDKEAAGTGVLSVSKGQMVDARADEMRLVRSVAAHAVEARPVELVWVLVDGSVPHAIARDADHASLGEVKTF